MQPVCGELTSPHQRRGLEVFIEPRLRLVMQTNYLLKSPLAQQREESAIEISIECFLQIVILSF
jgi:hypothetical protein